MWAVGGPRPPLHPSNHRPFPLEPRKTDPLVAPPWCVDSPGDSGRWFEMYWPDPSIGFSVPEVAVLERQLEVEALEERDRRLEIVSLLALHADLFALDLRLHLEP